MTASAFDVRFGPIGTLSSTGQLDELSETARDMRGHRRFGDVAQDDRHCRIRHQRDVKAIVDMCRRSHVDAMLRENCCECYFHHLTSKREAWTHAATGAEGRVAYGDGFR